MCTSIERSKAPNALALDEIHQHFARQHPAGVLGQRHQQIELIARELARSPSKRTARAAVSISRRAEVQGRSAGLPRTRRRRMARSRATSSRGSKGLGR